MTAPQTRDVDRQLPLGDEIFLDHVGHFAPDPQAACRALVRAGFAPTPVSVQVNPDGTPTGTGNVCAMLPRGYVEVLFKTADTPLGAELDTAMARYAGIHLGAFGVADAAKAHKRLGEAGFRLRPLVQFQRPVDTDSGTATAAFTVARVERGAMVEGRIQLLTHRTEDAVWQPRWLIHPNGAHGLASVAIVVADVAEAVARFVRFTDRPALPTSSGGTIQLDRGRIDLVTATAFAAMLPEIAIPSLPFMGACGLAVTSLESLEATLRNAGILARRSGSCLVVPFPDELGTGAWIFAEDSQASLFR